jgi:hypothetical protein
MDRMGTCTQGRKSATVSNGLKGMKCYEGRDIGHRYLSYVEVQGEVGQPQVLTLLTPYTIPRIVSHLHIPLVNSDRGGVGNQGRRLGVDHLLDWRWEML